MGIFGANKTTSPTPTPSASAFDNDKRKYPLSKNAQQLKSAISFSIGPMANAITRNDEQKLLSSNLVIMEQNEIIIKYLDDICKKLDKSPEE